MAGWLVVKSDVLSVPFALGVKVFFFFGFCWTLLDFVTFHIHALLSAFCNYTNTILLDYLETVANLQESGFCLHARRSLTKLAHSEMVRPRLL
jgi:hypothetical protein